ncbi:MAG: hypothetical protein DI535_02950 [Citrobacter freundii]|nr:MAG: hypothetical protein DI535_02950 [Citrobacter freundii]
MKKFLLSLFIASSCILFTAHAQIKKGAVLLGGDLNVRHTKVSVPDDVIRKETNVNLNASYGKAIRENLIFGGSVSWLNSSVDDENTVFDYKSNTWGLGAFLRKYQQLGSSGFFVFAQGALSGNYSYGKSRSNTLNESKGTGWSAALIAYPGISFSLTKKLQIETGLSDFLRLSYGHGRTDYENPMVADQVSNSLSFSSSIENFSNLYIGFRVLLN